MKGAVVGFEARRDGAGVGDAVVGGHENALGGRLGLKGVVCGVGRLQGDDVVELVALETRDAIWKNESGRAVR